MPPPTKKRKTAPKVEEIKFDYSAREEYLTGFHKRKLERIKHAQEESAKKEKEEKLRLRREMRNQRKEDLERHVKEVNMLLRKAAGEPTDSEADSGSDSDASDSWEGFDAEAAKESILEEIDREEEYIDEDKYTTVTVETVDVSKDGLRKVKGPEDSDDEDEDGDEDVDRVKKTPFERAVDAKGKRIWTKEKPKNDRPKKRKKKFRYETKAERKITRAKERSKGRKQSAERKK